LFVFSDGAKNTKSKDKINEVRNYLKTIEGFKSIQIYEAPVNKGLANSIIDGVTEIINKYGKVIVLEDDLITSPNFLDFMNQALMYYESEEKIFSISGYTLDLPSLRGETKDHYFGYRASSWGWGTWLDRWERVDWEVKSYPQFKSSYRQQKKFKRGGSDMPRMLHLQMKGKCDSWAIRWCYYQYTKDLLTLFPSKSKLKSIGFGGDATHTRNASRFITTMDESQQRKFTFSDKIRTDPVLIKEFRRKFSYISRLREKLK
jgi:hypothetical protein